MNPFPAPVAPSAVIRPCLSRGGVLKINHLSTDKIVSEAHDLYARWPHLTREEKQRIVESITEKIVIGKDEVAINLCYFPHSEEMTKWQRSLPYMVLSPSRIAFPKNQP